ncbi:ABC transporter ATP-binding protein [Streptomyces sp. NBC_01262]|uniref:ABC transporter ATP-binding protein n=1 Tax=Streptomyces sp. NBC_01262 TaxID=2903803 RepID=UPI002E32F761|nr:ABC transporter ATP-binding protein [Streptomyces sp. NBC_01262]
MTGTQPAPGPLLDVRDLSVAYRSRGGLREIVSAVSLSLDAGQTLGLVGESGCGKSTLAAALLGHLRAGARVTSGEVLVDGESLFAAPPARLRALRGGTVALVPQNAGHALTPTMRVGHQVREVLRVHRGLTGEAADAEAAVLFAQVRLPQPRVLLGRYPHELSGGQQQRVAIAMALAGNPRLLVLDEPTTGLDVVTQAGVLDLLTGIRRELGVAMVLVSHDLGVVSAACDRVAVMYAGRLVERGDTQATYDRPTHPYTRGLVASVPSLAEPGLPAAMPGTPPQPGSDLPGCSFAARCALVEERCTTGGAPELLLLPQPEAPSGDGHHSACLRAEEVRALPPEVRETHQRGARVGETAPVLVSLRDVAVDYRPRRARSQGPPTVAGIDLDIRRGETLALVGESGSGKSTLAWTIAGLRAPSAGTLVLQDGEAGTEDLARPAARRPPGLRKRLQLVFQNADTSLNPRRVVSDALRRPLRLFAQDGAAPLGERVDALLDDVGLDRELGGRLPGQLSGGQRQRVGIARALAAGPDLVLADEVVSALDVSVQASVLRLLDRLRTERGITYLFISHDLAVVRSIADRVAVLYLGRLCEVGDVEAVFSGPNHPYTRMLLDAVLEPGVRPEPGERRPVEEPESAPPEAGCPFQRRCPHALPGTCESVTPPWRDAEGGHRIRCHLELDVLASTTADTKELEAS